MARMVADFISQAPCSRPRRVYPQRSAFPGGLHGFLGHNELRPGQRPRGPIRADPIAWLYYYGSGRIGKSFPINASDNIYNVPWPTATLGSPVASGSLFPMTIPSLGRPQIVSPQIGTPFPRPV